jgi:CheY-like chemotaxis protein/CheY-specific phosphatase CheX
MDFAISEENFKTFVEDAVMTVFDLVFNISIEPSLSAPSGEDREIQVIGMVGIAGAHRGMVCVKIGEAFSHVITAAMLGLDPGASQATVDVNDVVGELTNIIAGKVKFCLRSGKEISNLSLPTVIRGHHIDLESISGVEHRHFAFFHQSYSVVVELYSVIEQEDSNMNTPKILLVDDSKATRSVVAKVFSPYNCEIIEASNGALCLEMARMHQPALIILDITMPIMNGIETLERLRIDPHTQDIPVIMLSANSNPEELEHMKIKGLVSYVTKTQKPGIILESALGVLKLELKSAPASH